MKLIPGNLTADQKRKRKTIIVIVVILALGLTVGILLYVAGKKKGKSQNQINISSPLTADGSTPVASDSEIRQLAVKLHDDMEGVNMWGHDLSPWTSFLALNDSDVIRLNNQFNTQYQLESEETFRSWVENEYAGSDDWSGVKPGVIARLSKLNIT